MLIRRALLAIGLIFTLVLACSQPEGSVQPTPPTEVRAAETTPTSLRLTWQPSASAEVIGYRVYRSLEEGSPEEIATEANRQTLIIQETSLLQSDLSPETTYYYVVASVDARGNEARSTVIPVTTPADPSDPGDGDDPGEDPGDGDGPGDGPGDGNGPGDGPGDGDAAFTQLRWTSLASAPHRRTEAQGGVVKGKLYVFGGYSSFDPVTFLASVNVYDPGANTWTSLANMPTPLTHAGSAVSGENFYFAGGYVPNQPGIPGESQIFATDQVWRFNVTSNQWTALPPLPEARGAGALVVLNRHLHFVGGSNLARQDKADHWVLPLDEASPAWRYATPLPKARNHLSAVTLNGKIYVIGGQQGQDEKSVVQAQVTVWDPATEAWTQAASLPSPVSHASASTFAMGGRILVVGGEVEHLEPVAEVWAYDAEGDAWSALTALPRRVNGGVAGAVDGKIIFSGGNLMAATYLGTPID